MDKNNNTSNTPKIQKTHSSIDKKNLAKSVILQYLTHIYEYSHGNVTKINVSDLESCASDTALIEKTFEILKTTYDIHNTEYKDVTPGKICISRNTIDSAIKELAKSNQIVKDKKNKCWKLIPPDEHIFQEHPILNIADQINITPLSCSNIFYFHVNPLYADAVTAFINSNTKNVLTRAFNLNGIIMCMELEPDFVMQRGYQYNKPSYNNPDFAKRMCKMLHSFNLTTVEGNPIKNIDNYFAPYRHTPTPPSAADDDLNPITIDEIIQAEENSNRAYRDRIKEVFVKAGFPDAVADPDDPNFDFALYDQLNSRESNPFISGLSETDEP